jgi:NADPH-dependent 2,4-dienoyl-CoA reductase/sulfur reductase-like enzyme
VSSLYKLEVRMSPETVELGLLVVGSGPAGLAAAEAYRERGGTGAVQVVTDDPHAPYARPPLSKDFLRGEADEASLLLREHSSYRDQEIEVVQGCAVEDLDPIRRRAVLQDGRRVNYRACVLATGSRPRSIEVEGGDHPAVRYLRSLHDARILRATAAGASRAVVVGSGFIGCEAAASLARRGLEVSVVAGERLPLQSRLGDAASGRIAGWLMGEGVRLVLDVEVTGIEHAETVHVRDRGSIQADLVLVAVGAVPEVGLARRAGLRLDRGRVRVDAGMHTAAPGLYAAGDVALADNAAAGRPLVVEHWGEGERMGQIAGANAAGADERWDNVPGFWSTIGDHTLKYAAWGDGFDRAELEDRGAGFVVRYWREGGLVGVLTHEADDAYKAAPDDIVAGAGWPH